MSILVTLEKTNKDLSTRAQASRCFKYIRKNGLNIDEVYRDALAVLLELHTIELRSQAIKQSISRRNTRLSGTAL